MQLGGRHQQFQILVLQAKTFAHAPSQIGQLLYVSAKPRVAFADQADEHVSPLQARRGMTSDLLRIQPLIGYPQRLLHFAGLDAEQHLAVAGADGEMLARLDQRARELAGQRRRVPAAGQQRAELVAAER